MNRRRRAPSHANHERWLVSYADFITLLFAFFVVLYASAQVDKHKMGKLAVAIQVAFQELGAFPNSADRAPVDINQPLPVFAMQALEHAKRNPDSTIVTPPSSEAPAPTISDESNFLALQDELQQALQNELASHTVALHRESEGIVISLREFGFFDSGSATLKPSAFPALDRIASVLVVRNCRLRIEGHTDDIPIHTSQMASNWELSTARSTEIVRILTLRYRFSPERLSAAGYAQYHPVASNDTPEGRAQNRRVDVVILSGQAERSNVIAPTKPSPAIP